MYYTMRKTVAFRPTICQRPGRRHACKVIVYAKRESSHITGRYLLIENARLIFLYNLRL